MATYKDNVTIKEQNKNSLVLKNLEIWDKVTHSQAIACSFGGVGRTDTLFSGSQTGEKIKNTTLITIINYLFNRKWSLQPENSRHHDIHYTKVKIYSVFKLIRVGYIYFFPSCCCRCCSWIPSTAWWKLNTGGRQKGPSIRGHFWFKNLNERAFTHQCGHGQKSLISPPILVILHVIQTNPTLHVCTTANIYRPHVFSYNHYILHNNNVLHSRHVNSAVKLSGFHLEFKTQ